MFVVLILLIKESLKVKYNLVNEYLKQEVLVNSHIMDIGWACSVQNALHNILNTDILLRKIIINSDSI